MQSRPTVLELLRGISRFMEKDQVPSLEEPLRFHTRIAGNLLKIIERELQTEETHLAREGSRLAELLGAEPPRPDRPRMLRVRVRKLNEELCREIRSGRADQGPWREAVLDHLSLTVRETLETTNPGLVSDK